MNLSNLALRWQVYRMSTNVTRPGAGVRQLVAAFAEREEAQEYGEERVAGDFTEFEVVDATVQS